MVLQQGQEGQVQLADWQRKASSTAVVPISQLHLSLLAPFGKLSLDSKLAYGNLLLEIKRVRLSAQKPQTRPTKKEHHL